MLCGVVGGSMYSGALHDDLKPQRNIDGVWYVFVSENVLFTPKLF